MNDENGTRAIVATLFDSAGGTSNALADGVSGGAATALRVGGGIGRLVAALIRSHGIENVRDELAALALKQTEAAITRGDIAEDDRTIEDAILAMYGESATE